MTESDFGLKHDTKAQRSGAAPQLVSNNEYQELRRRLVAFVRREFPALAIEHDELVDEAITAHCRTFAARNGASRITHARTIVTRLAQRARKKRLRENALLEAARVKASELALAAKGPSEQSLQGQPKRSSRQDFTLSRKLGEFREEWGEHFATCIMSGTLFRRDDEEIHYQVCGIDAQRKLGRVPGPDFVKELVAFRRRAIRIGDGWVESVATVNGRLVARGRPTKSATSQTTDLSDVAVAFRAKRVEAGLKLASRALHLLGFSTDEIAQWERRRSAAAKKEERSLPRRHATAEAAEILANILAEAGYPIVAGHSRAPAFRSRSGRKAK